MKFWYYRHQEWVASVMLTLVCIALCYVYWNAMMEQTDKWRIGLGGAALGYMLRSWDGIIKDALFGWRKS